MPRNSTSTARKTTHAISPLAPPMPPAPLTNSPSLGSTLVHSVTSGLGSGVGFGLGSSLVRSIFGSTPSASPPNNDYIQCLEANKFTDRESNCYHLSDSYKACMIRTNFNRGECSRD
jgi:hypothetical protein